MARVSKKVRAEAIEALLCCAESNVVGPRIMIHENFGDLGDQVCEQRAIANAAFTSTRPLLGMDHEQLQPRYLEAAALLRDGWCPGDPVHLLSTKERS